LRPKVRPQITEKTKHNHKRHTSMRFYRRFILFVLLGVALFLVTGAALAASTPLIAWQTVAGGGGPSSAGAITANGTLGQPLAGLSAGGSVSLNAGFWQSPIAYPQTNIFLPLLKK
jgi:hypothetical protein